MARQPKRITVTKLDAARRQIETAISLWFNDGDEVSIPTLTAAAHHVCHDIAKANGGKSPFFFNVDIIRPDRHAEYKKLVCEAENFFKHADDDHDPNAILVFTPEVTEAYIFDAIELFLMLNGKITHLMMAFRFRFQLSNPSLVTSDFKPVLKEPISINLGRLSKREFLEEYLRLIPLFRRK